MTQNPITKAKHADHPDAMERDITIIMPAPGLIAKAPTARARVMIASNVMINYPSFLDDFRAEFLVFTLKTGYIIIIQK